MPEQLPPHEGEGEYRELPPREQHDPRYRPGPPEDPRRYEPRDREDPYPRVEGKVGQVMVAGGWLARTLYTIIGGEHGQRMVIFLLACLVIGMVIYIGWRSMVSFETTTAMIVRNDNERADHMAHECDDRDSKMRTFFSEESAKSRLAFSEEAGKVRADMKDRTADMFRYFSGEREKDRSAMADRDKMWQAFFSRMFGKAPQLPEEDDRPVPLIFPWIDGPAVIPVPRLKAPEIPPAKGG